MKVSEYNYWRVNDRENLEEIKRARDLENKNLSLYEKISLVKYQIYRLQNGDLVMIKTVPVLTLVINIIAIFLASCAVGVYETFSEIKEEIKNNNIVGKYRKAKKVK